MVDLASLNPPQRAAVEHRDGPLLILAGAGSGKTRVITYRIARLIETGVEPSNILAVSFTNKAANEMRERVRELIPAKLARRCHLSTFHSLGLRILTESAQYLGYRIPFTITDESERYQVLKAALKDLGLEGTSSNDANLLRLISQAKNANTTPAQLPEARYNPDMPRAQLVYKRYLQVMKNLNAVDFDDLLLLPTKLLREHPELKAKYQERYRYVMVDEYQDTNLVQLQFLSELVGAPDYNLAVVGDDDQSIYGFRGAVADNILAFGDHFPGTKVITLEQNYRSVRSILTAANAVIKNNKSRKDKELWSDLGDGRAIRSFVLNTQSEEAEFIARRIREQKVRANRSWNDFAILYRANNQARYLEETLSALRIPYKVVGGQSVFDKREIRDTMAWLRLLINPKDEMALRRAIHAPPRGIGVKTIQMVDEYAKRHKVSLYDSLTFALETSSLNSRAEQGFSSLMQMLKRGREEINSLPGDELEDFLWHWVNESGLLAWIRSSENAPSARARVDAIERFIESSHRAPGDNAADKLIEFINSATLEPTSDSANKDEPVECVTLMTIHASKGLEFPIVYLSGMNEQLLPHKRAIEAGDGIAEERRLCYVGMTRAKRDLILTRSKFRSVRNTWQAHKPSRFLSEIPPQLIDERDISAAQPAIPAHVEDKLYRESIEKMEQLLKGNQTSKREADGG